MVDSMRLALITDYYWPHIGGGVEVVVQQLAERLALRGHTVSVLTLNTEGAPFKERINNVNVFRLPSLELTHLVGMQLAIPLNPLMLASFLRFCQAEVIHVHNRFFTASALAISLRNGTPAVFTLHLGPVAMGKAVSLYERVISKGLLRAANTVTAVSHLAAKVYPGSRVIPNGVDIERFQPPLTEKDGFKVMCVGRLIRNKGPLRLLEAIPHMHPDVSVVFVGDGPLRSSLEARSVQLGIADRVLFQGIRPDVHLILPTASLLVRASDTEGMSLAVLEALACGLPVIASPASAGDLIEHGVNGFRLEEMSPEEIAGYVNQLHSGPRKLREMSFEARRTAERFSWEKSLDEYEEVYRDTVRGKRDA